MFKFIWVESEDVDIEGEWLKILKEENEKFLCERGGWWQPDVWVNKTEAIHETIDQVF